MIDLADQRFGRLVALRACAYRKDGRMRCCASAIVAVSWRSAVTVSEAVTRRAAVVYVLLTLPASVSAGLRL